MAPRWEDHRPRPINEIVWMSVRANRMSRSPSSKLEAPLPSPIAVTFSDFHPSLVTTIEQCVCGLNSGERLDGFGIIVYADSGMLDDASSPPPLQPREVKTVAVTVAKARLCLIDASRFE